MPRPCKRRKVCSMPGYGHFGPAQRREGSTPIQMGVDEYECIRLIDLEGMTQEECALRMEVARTTVQSIYNTARRKLALCLVEGRELVIQGGNYELCPESDHPCGASCRHHCHKIKGESARE